MNKNPVLKNLQNFFWMISVPQKALETLQYISEECKYAKMWVCSRSHKPYDWLSKFLVSVKKWLYNFSWPYLAWRNMPLSNNQKLSLGSIKKNQLPRRCIWLFVERNLWISSCSFNFTLSLLLLLWLELLILSLLIQLLR